MVKHETCWVQVILSNNFWRRKKGEDVGKHVLTTRPLILLSSASSVLSLLIINYFHHIIERGDPAINFSMLRLNSIKTSSFSLNFFFSLSLSLSLFVIDGAS